MRKAFFILIFLSAAPARAAFLDPHWGARPSGMGGAFAAVADDANAVFYNPAGAVQIKRAQTSFMHAKLFLGLGEHVNLNLNSFFGLVPLSGAPVLGAGWTNFRAPVYREDVGYLLVAQSLNRFWPGLGPQVAVGGNLKFMQTRFDLDARTAADPVFSEKRSQNVLSLDVGLWSRPLPKGLPGLRLGLVGRNLNRPDVGLYTEDKVRENVVGGLAYDLSRFTFAADVYKRPNEVSLRGGVEFRLLDRRVFRTLALSGHDEYAVRDAVPFHRQFALRAGANRTAVTTGLSYEFSLGENLGAGIDYALSIPFYVEDSDGSHRIAVNMRF